VIKAQKKQELTWLVVVSALGLCEALRAGKVSFDTAGTLLFWPFSRDKLQENDFDSELIDILYRASELEDVYRLAPDQYSNVLSELINAIHVYMNSLSQEIVADKKWLPDLLETSSID